MVAVLLGKMLCVRDDVRALVAVFRERHGVLALINLEIARFERRCEFINLVARVVYVEFALDVITRRVEDARQAVANRTPARVADVHRARRVCGDELDQHPLAAAEIAAAIPFAVFADLPQHGRVKGGAVVKV